MWLSKLGQIITGVINSYHVNPRRIQIGVIIYISSCVVECLTYTVFYLVLFIRLKLRIF